MSHRWLHVGRGDAAALSTTIHSGDDRDGAHAQEIRETVGTEDGTGLLPVQAVKKRTRPSGTYTGAVSILTWSKSELNAALLVDSYCNQACATYTRGLISPSIQSSFITFQHGKCNFVLQGVSI